MAETALHTRGRVKTRTRSWVRKHQESRRALYELSLRDCPQYQIKIAPRQRLREFSHGLPPKLPFGEVVGGVGEPRISCGLQPFWATISFCNRSAAVNLDGEPAMFYRP